MSDDIIYIQVIHNKTSKELCDLKTIPSIGHGVVVGKRVYRVVDVVHHRYQNEAYKRVHNKVRVYVEPKE